MAETVSSNLFESLFYHYGSIMAELSHQSRSHWPLNTKYFTNHQNCVIL